MRKAADHRRALVLIATTAALLVAAALALRGSGLVGPAAHAPRASATGDRAPASPLREAARRSNATTPSRKRAHTALPQSKQNAVGARTRAGGTHRKATQPSRLRTLADVTTGLCATTGTVTMSDGQSIPIWGFAPSCSDQAQLPGPQIDATAGDVVTLNVTNNIPGHTLSIEVPGVDVTSGATDADFGETVSVTFTTPSEGTFLYESAGDAGRQEAMGLYGALIVHSATSGQAYGTPVAGERTLVLSEIDRAFNLNPDGFDMRDWHPTYWLINGIDHPNAPSISVPTGDILLRYANAGVDHNTMTTLGLRQRLLARDGYPLSNPFSVVSETFPAGGTGDALVTIPAVPSGTKFPVYNRNLNLGMMRFLQVQ